MLKADVQVGETYLFTGSSSPKRQHLAGELFTVHDAKQVWRKMTYMRGRRTTKTWRFFNEDGIGARAEELEPLPGEGHEDWRDASQQPPAEGLYMVMTDAQGYLRTGYKAGFWDYDLETEEMAAIVGMGMPDKVKKWLFERMKTCRTCRQLLPVTSFPTAGSVTCNICEKPDIAF